MLKETFFYSELFFFLYNKHMDIFNSQSILAEKRRVWIDSDKGISILLVGFGHCLATLQNKGLAMDDYPAITYISVFLYGFRMPLFFIISGIFISGGLQKKGIKGYCAYRADTILYPLMVWGFIEITLSLITARFTNNGTTPISYLNLIIDARQTGHFWYLNALFFIGVLYAVTRAWLNITPLKQVIVGLLLYAVASYIHLNDINAGSLTDIFGYYIFFAIGDLISSNVLSAKFEKHFSSFKIFVPLLAVFLFSQYYFAQYNMNGGPDGINYVEHKMPLFFLFEALIGCAISINFSFLLQRYNKLNFLRVIGYHSLYIYCMQIIVMTVSRIVLVNILHFTYVPVLVLAIWAAGIVIPMLLYNVFMHFKMWWLFTFRQPKLKQTSVEGTANAQGYIPTLNTSVVN